MVAKPFSYDVGFEGSGDTIEVPAGFVSDLASIPRLLRCIFPTAGVVAKAALLHDYLLETDPDRADDVFSEALKVADAHWLTRFCLVTGVRVWSLFR